MASVEVEEDSQQSESCSNGQVVFANVFEESPVLQDKLSSSDINTSKLSATRKRMHPSPSTVTTLLNEVPDLLSEQEEPRSAKRRRPAEQRPGTVFSPASTPRLNPAPSLSGQNSPHRATQNLNLSFSRSQDDDGAVL